MSPEQIKFIRENRLGEVVKNSQGELMKIINYRNSADIDVQYLDTGSIRCHQRYDNFKKGLLKDSWLPTIHGAGILEDGEIYDGNKIKKLSFIYWESMLRRCYCEAELVKYPTYRSCCVCDEWLRFPNFEKWFHKNYYECGEEKMNVEKDILLKGNKVYSPETTIFVPERINNLFTKTNSKRGSYPIGVYYDKTKKRFVAQISMLENEQKNSKRQITLGSFKTPEEAFARYKHAKENYIKEVADFYLQKYQNFPQKLYDALCNYQVEITD